MLKHLMNAENDPHSSNLRTPLPLIDISQIRARLKELPGWQIEDTHLVKSYHFEQADDAVAFLVHIGIVAAEHNHHPHVYWWKRDVRIELWTHKSNGLTSYDFDFAAHCDPSPVAQPSQTTATARESAHGVLSEVTR